MQNILHCSFLIQIAHILLNRHDGMEIQNQKSSKRDACNDGDNETETFFYVRGNKLKIYK